MLRFTQVVLVAAFVGSVSSAAQSVVRSSGVGSSKLTPEHLENAKQEDNSGQASELLPDVSRMNGRDGMGEEAGTTVTKSKDDVAKTIHFESGRKLADVPPDLAETAVPTKLKIKEGAEIIDEIEVILSKVREQYSKKSRSPTASDAEGKVSSKTPQSITDLLKHSTSQVNDETLQEDPVIEDARQRYMSIWNKEADRLNASYMKVTKAWPELGMVYMPVVTKVSDQIKASESVKEAERVFKNVWERRLTEIDSPAPTVEPVLQVLNNFMNAWLWAENADKNASTAEIDVSSGRGEQISRNTDAGRTTGEKKLQGQGDSLTGKNMLSDLDSRLGALYETIFHTRRTQASLGPSSVSKSTKPLEALSTNKLILSCSVVPGDGGNEMAGTAPMPSKNPIVDHRPVGNPIADIRPIIDPFRVLDSVKQHLGANTRPVRLQPTRGKPITVTRPFVNPAARPTGVTRPLSTPILNPIAYLRALERRPAEATPVARYPSKEGNAARERDFTESGEDVSRSSESEEQFIHQSSSQHTQEQPHWQRHATP